jgi:LuxR family transcriptional regulator, maltose regulon positive regulatory protein
MASDLTSLAGGSSEVPMVAKRNRRSVVSSGDPILVSKITVPGVPDWAVQRPQVTGLIARGTRWCPLTVLTGPPGAGKTMALASWAAARPEPVAWVSLDEYDSRPEFFWLYVTAALDRCGVAVPKTWPVEWGDEAGHLFVLRLAAALADRDQPVMLVLDDLHLVTGAEVLKGLDFVLRNAADGLRLAASSRMDPLLPLHRYRVAGQLAEIRAGNLAFSSAEAGLLLARHGIELSADSLESLIRRTEGWAAGLRLAALSMDAHPDPDLFVKELAAEDSALTGYLVDEVLAAQPAEVREVLLYTSILDRVSADAAVELAGDEQAAATFSALTRANAFIQSAGSGRYRYHSLFAEVLRLKLRREYPDRVPVLHRRAARWHMRNGLLADAVRHAAQADDWPLAAEMVINDLAVGDLLEPGDGHRLVGEFHAMPPEQAWIEPAPYLVAAAMALSAGEPGSCLASLQAADEILERVPADEQPECRLAAALIRLAACPRAGDLAGAAAAAARAEMLLGSVPGGTLARRPGIRARVLSGRGAVELWSGRLDEAARVLESGVAVAATSGRQQDRADCLGRLALVEALRGRLGHAAKLATRATAELTAAEQRSPGQSANSAALVALAWVHLHRNELREARRCFKQADATLGITSDKMVATVAHLVAALGSLAEGNTEAAAGIVATARSGWSLPAWLDQQLSLVESRACATAGDIPAALAAAERAGRDEPLEAAVALAHVWATAEEDENARRVLAPALAAHNEAPERVRLQAWLTDAQLSYHSGDHAHGHRSLTSALRVAEREQLRLPFALERGWIEPVLRQDPELVNAHGGLLAPVPRREQLPAAPSAPGQASALVVEPLTEREREVLQHVSRMLNTAEVASEMFISTNTVKTHLRSIYRKLAAAHRGEAVRRARELELI